MSSFSGWNHRRHGVLQHRFVCQRFAGPSVHAGRLPTLDVDVRARQQPSRRLLRRRGRPSSHGGHPAPATSGEHDTTRPRPAFGTLGFPSGAAHRRNLQPARIPSAPSEHCQRQLLGGDAREVRAHAPNDVGEPISDALLLLVRHWTFPKSRRRLGQRRTFPTAVLQAPSAARIPSRFRRLQRGESALSRFHCSVPRRLQQALGMRLFLRRRRPRDVRLDGGVHGRRRANAERELDGH